MTKKRARKLLTRQELAEALGQHSHTILRWDQSGCPVAKRGRPGVASMYDLAAVRRWLKARDANARETLGSVAVERARKERAQAALAEQEYQRRSGVLLPAQEVERVWAGEVAAIRQADELTQIAMTQGAPGVEAKLKDLAFGLLRELSDPTRPIAGEASTTKEK